MNLRLLLLSIWILLSLIMSFALAKAAARPIPNKWRCTKCGNDQEGNTFCYFDGCDGSYFKPAKPNLRGHRLGRLLKVNGIFK